MRTPFTLTTITAMTFAGVLTLNAQTPQPQSTPRTQPQTDRQRTGSDTQARGSEQAVTITGCLKAGSDMSGGAATGSSTAGSAASSGNSNAHYMLTNVKMGQGSSTSAMGLASAYEVKGVSDSELQRHLNHQVEVTGRINNSGSSNMGSGRSSGTTGSGTTGTTGTTGSGTTGTTGTTGQRTGGSGMSGMSAHDTQEIQATSIRMIAQTCPANQ